MASKRSAASITAGGLMGVVFVIWLLIRGVIGSDAPVADPAVDSVGASISVGDTDRSGLVIASVDREPGGFWECTPEGFSASLPCTSYTVR